MNRENPTFIKVGPVTVVDRSGRSRTRAEYVRDIQGLVFSGEPDGSEKPPRWQVVAGL